MIVGRITSVALNAQKAKKEEGSFCFLFRAEILFSVFSGYMFWQGS